MIHQLYRHEAKMSALQMNTVVNYTLNDYVTLIMTIMNYMFIHDKMTYWMDNMSEKTMSTFIQVNFLMGMTLFTYSYVCFFYNDFVRGVYTTMWSFLMFYNIFMAQVKLMAKSQLSSVAYTSTDDSDTSDDEVDVDEEDEEFEEEMIKNQDEKLVENIVNKILEMAVEKENEREIAEILVNQFKNALNAVEDVVQPAPEVAEAAPQEAAPEAAPQEPISPTENSVSDSPVDEGTPVADVIMDESA